MEQHKVEQTIIDSKIIKGFFDLFDDQPSGQSFVNDLIGVFQETGAQVVSQIEEASHVGDARSASRLAHKLKGLARNIGACVLSHICQELEDVDENANELLLKNISSEIRKAFLICNDELNAKFYRRSS